MGETVRMPRMGGRGGSDSLPRQMVERLPTVLWSTDCELRVTSAFGAGLVALSLRPDQFVGMTLERCFQIEVPNSPFLAAHRRALRGESALFEHDWAGQMVNRRKAVDFFQKPFGAEELIRSIRKAIKADEASWRRRSTPAEGQVQGTP